MNGIDQFAYCSPLKNIHPAEKVFMAISTLLLVVSLESYLLSALVFGSMSYLLLVKARVKGGFYLRIMGIPLGFLLLACLTVAVSWNARRADHLYYLYWGAVGLGVTNVSLYQAGQLLLKSLAAVSCLYFLALTTPVVQLIYIMQRIKLPPVLIDLATIIYSNIFVFILIAYEIYIAQLSRGGYKGFMGSMKALALLCSNLILKSLKVSEDAFNCLLSRGFEGHFKVVEEAYQLRIINIMAILGWNTLLLIIYFMGGV